MIGYAIRLTEVNGYGSPGTILCYAGYGTSNAFGVNCDLQLLADVVDKNVEDFSAFSYSHGIVRSDKSVLYRGHEISSWRIARVLSPKRSKFCPICIRERGFIDSYWDLTLATICPTHGCKALQFCPACKKAISWLRPGLLTCRCGAELSGFPPEAAAASAVELLGLAQAKLLGEKPLAHPTKSQLPVTELNGMTFVQLMSVFFLLGQHLLRLSHTEALSNPDRVLAMAGRSLENWPRGFRECLRDLEKHDVGVKCQLSRLRNQYGPLYRSLVGEKYLKQASGFIWHEIERFLGDEKSRAVLQDRRLVGTSNVRLRKSMTVEWICSKFAFSRKRIEGWCRFNRKDSLSLTPSDLQAFVVEMEIISHLKVGKEHRVTERKAAAMADLPVSVMYGLRDLGYVQGTSRSKTSLGYRESSIQSLVSRLQAIGCRICSSLVDPSKHISFSRVLETSTFWSNSGKAKFVADVLEGRVTPHGRIGDSPQLLYFVRSAVNDYIEAKREDASKGLLTLREAGTIAGVSSDCVAELARIGRLTTHAGPYYRSICEESVKKFSGSYVTINDAAVKLKSTSRALRWRAERQGRELLTITSRRGVRTAFLRRSEVDDFVSQIKRARKKAQRRLQKWREQNNTMEKLQEYLEQLKSTGCPLPRIGRSPNIRRIADASGFDRNAFYSNKKLREILTNFDEEEVKRRGLNRRTDLEVLEYYLESLSKNGKPIPTRNRGKINKKAIAIEAGIERDVFYKSPEADNLVSKYFSSHLRISG